jgi:hypothetical protein
MPRTAAALLLGAILGPGTSCLAANDTAETATTQAGRSPSWQIHSFADQQDQTGLRQFDAPKLIGGGNAAVYVEGYFAPGDGGNGTFDWDPKSNAPDDNWAVIKPYSVPSSHPGRFIRRIQLGNLSFEQFGATGDGHTDDAKAIQNAINTLTASYARGVPGVTFHLLPGKRYLLDSGPIHLSANVRIEGPTPVGNWPGNGKQSAFFYGSGFLVNPAIASRGGIALMDTDAALRNLWVYNKDLVDTPSAAQVEAAVAQWQKDNSIGVLLHSTGGYLDDVQVIGFTTGIKVEHAGRFKIIDANVDSVNGIDISNVGDTSYVERAHLTPWYSLNVQGENASWYRPGVGINIHDQADGLTVNGALVLGWRTGYRLSNVWTVTLSDIKVDGGAYNAEHFPMVGIETANKCFYCQIRNPIVDGVDTNFLFNHVDGDGKSNVVVIGGSSQFARGATNAVHFSLGTGARVGIFDVQVNAGQALIFKIAPNIRGAVVHNLMVMQGVPTVWKQVDPTSVGSFKFSDIWNMDVTPPTQLH